MQPFRFRAAAALDLRKRAEDAAREQLARANAAHAEAVARLASAADAVRAAAARFETVQRAGVSGTEIHWHRCWMTRLQIEADAYRRTAAVSAATAQRAAASVREAFQRRRALEQLRDRAWRRHQREVARADQRAMNELASLRFLAQAAKAGGIHGDD